MGLTMQDVLKYHGFMFKIALNYTNDKQLAEDAVQESYLYLCEQQRIRGLDFLEYKGKANTHYLSMLARSKCLNLVRSERRRNEREQSYGNDYLRDQHSESQAQEYDPYLAKRHMVDSLEKIEPYYRELLKLVYFRKIKQNELAQILEVPYQTIKNDVKQARIKLREQAQKTGATKESECR